ncbi:HIT domain-containing protein [Endozoicomonas sp. GU-1]|uniref:HIT domain-containing protein n=1 Tax=Endozoicomonas sp. GU-1 TaxID=3009078 RepID=UPI0022B55431|nr:HIT domain-containing protein [Endozoicomonas sp. GU-1]WBA80169.1 HIT domain-containing protein [Endozoicomonas sp. GU-1]WBA87745.1 HIT domain-containing protein [Endozoicomonas sp. GU-1]
MGCTVSSFELDPQLARDCVVIGDFPVCRLLLMNDSQYPWFILVPRIQGVEEIYQLDEAAQQQLLFESSYLAEMLQVLFCADKMNVAALGNVVRQLHVHHVVRFTADAAWPAPVWGRHPARPYTDEQLAEVMHKLKTGITDMPSFQWA